MAGDQDAAGGGMSDEEIPFQLEPIVFRDDDGSWRPRIRVYVDFPDHGLEEIVLESGEEVTFEEEAEARTYSERLGLKYLLDRARGDVPETGSGAETSAPSADEGS